MGIIQILREEVSARRASLAEERRAQQSMLRVAEAASGTLSEMLDEVQNYTKITSQLETVEPTSDELRRIRKALRVLWYSSPVAAQRAWLLKCGTFGKGITAPTASDERVQEVVTRFWEDRDNQVCLFSHEGMSLTNLLLLLEGERFISVHTSEAESVVKLGDIPPDEITAVIPHPGNRRQPVLYQRTFHPRTWDFRIGAWGTSQEKAVWYYRDLRYAEGREEAVTDRAVAELLASTPGLQEDVAIRHIKADSLGLRGYPEMARSVPWARQHVAALSDLATIVKALGAFAWKKKVTTKSGDAIRAAAEMLRTPPPGAAAVQVENQNVSLEPINVSTGHTGNQTATAREMFLQAIRDGGFGEHWFGDATRGNLATAAAMELPAIWRIEDRQQLLEGIFRELVEFAIDRAMLLGDFPRPVIAPDADLTVDIDFPAAQPLTEVTRTNLVTSVVTAQQAGLLPPREASFLVLQLLGSNNISETLDAMYAGDPAGGMAVVRPFPVSRATEAVVVSRSASLQATRLEASFAAALDREVFAPWYAALRRWLVSQGEAIPGAGELELALAGPLQPDSEALQRVLDKYLVAAGEVGGAAGVAKVLTAGRRRVREAAGDRKPTRTQFVFRLSDPRVLAQLQERGTAITGEVTATMLSDLRGVLTREFYEEGRGPLAMAKELETIFPVTYARRGETIARTETLFAQALVQNESYRRNGVEKKQWLTLMDDKTRPDHADMNGKTVPMNEDFQLPDGSSIAHPGAPSGDPAQVVNCRCDFLPVIGEEFEIPKQPWLGGE